MRFTLFFFTQDWIVAVWCRCTFCHNLHRLSLQRLKHAQWPVDLPGVFIGNEQMIGSHLLVGRNFSEANARIFRPVTERTADFRHLIDS